MSREHLTSDFTQYPSSSKGKDNPDGRFKKHGTVKNRESVHEIVNPDDDDTSTIDENYDIESLASSIEDQLTWVRSLLVQFFFVFNVYVFCCCYF